MKLTLTDHSDLWIQQLTRQYDLLAAKEGFRGDQPHKHQLADSKVAAEWAGLPPTVWFASILRFAAPKLSCHLLFMTPHKGNYLMRCSYSPILCLLYESQSCVSADAIFTHSMFRTHNSFCIYLPCLHICREDLWELSNRKIHYYKYITNRKVAETQIVKSRVVIWLLRVYKSILQQYLYAVCLIFMSIIIYHVYLRYVGALILCSWVNYICRLLCIIDLLSKKKNRKEL